MITVCEKCKEEYSGDAPVCIPCQRAGAHVVHGSCHCPPCTKPALELKTLAARRAELRRTAIENPLGRTAALAELGELVLLAERLQREVVIV